MDDLDKKIFEIVKHVSNEDGYVEDSIAVVAVTRIKKAFKDDGWLRTIDVSMPAVTNYDRPTK